MTNIIVGHAFDIPQAHRQQGLCPFQGLNLAFFIDAQHYGLIRRIQIQTDDVPHLFYEEGIARQLKVTLAVRLQTKSVPDALYRVLGNAKLRGQRTTTPRRAARGSGLQRLANEHRYPLIADRARPPRTQLVVQAGQSLAKKTSPPVADGDRVQSQPRRNGLVTHPRSTQQNDLGPRHQSVRETARDRNGAELSVFLRVQNQRGFGSSQSHRHLHSLTKVPPAQRPRQ